MCFKMAMYGYVPRLQSTDEYCAAAGQGQLVAEQGQASRGRQSGSPILRSRSGGAKNPRMYRRLSFSPDDYLRTFRQRSWASARGVDFSGPDDGEVESSFSAEEGIVGTFPGYKPAEVTEPESSDEIMAAQSEIDANFCSEGGDTR